ncbi:MAG: pyridoxamine 5'-phosphate oxidase family protein [Clostridiales bacterium]|jgi:hypothetical protein|nr:pyridoxamine 5'-phosphate oxidase family protein [Clostridiales bacterium]
MFQVMRRSRQALSWQETEEILRRGTSGVLALAGAEGYPYAVPLSYVYTQGILYFHCAKVGHKLESIRRCEKASFCVVDRDEIKPEAYTTYYRSAIAFGRVRILESEEEKRRAIEQLSQKYHPMDTPAHRKAVIDREYAPLCMLAFTVEHMTGKQAIELTKA